MRTLLLVLPILSVFAHPIPSSFISGEVHFSSRSNQMEVKTSDRAIIEWEQFNIEPNEILRFIQPSPKSMTLIRIQDQKLSTILGRIEAKGQIILMHPRRFLFGDRSSIHDF